MTKKILANLTVVLEQIDEIKRVLLTVSSVCNLLSIIKHNGLERENLPSIAFLLKKSINTEQDELQTLYTKISAFSEEKKA